MRKVDESRAANYIRKHSNYKKWLAFVLCLSLLTGTVTLYILNKPATAMTEEGAESIGAILETASNADEETLIQQTMENKSVSNDNGDDDLFSEFNEDGDDESDDELEESGDDEEKQDDLVEEEAKEEEAKEGEVKEGELKEGEEQEEAEEEDELTQDVVLTVSYVDEAGEAIADEKEIDIYDSIDLTSEAPSIEGYTFKEATFKGDVITKVAVKKNADDIRYYEVTFDGDETKEIKKDAAVVLTYIKDEEEVEVDASVTLTAKYVDKDGEDIQDSEEISFAKETSINKDNAPEIDGYFFMKAVYDEQEIVKITPVEAEAEGEADETGDATEDADEKVKTVSVEGYEFTTADGDTVEITEDAEIEYTYGKFNTQDEFVFSNEEYTVTVKLSNPEALPEGVELKVATVDKDTEGYNYDAYMAALNENAQKILEANGEKENADVVLDDDKPLYDGNNTVLLDIAFMLEEIEYEPKDGTVSVSIRFNNNQISDELGAEDAGEVAVVHLPVKEDIMQEVNATSEATDIVSSDVTVDVLTDSTISLKGSTDLVSFETGSFSVYAAVRTIIPGTYTWTGTGLDDNSATGIVSSLGKSIYFGVVADHLEVSNHFESNLAVNSIGTGLGENTVFDYSDYINRNVEYTDFKISVTKKSTAPGQFKFGLFKNADGTGLVEKFTIDASSLVEGWYQGTHVCSSSLTGKQNLYVYEIDDETDDETVKIVKSGESNGTYKVEYSSDIGPTNDLADSLISSYIKNLPSDERYLKKILRLGSSIYHPVSGGYERVKNVGDGQEIPLERTTFEGEIPVKADDLLGYAKALSKELPYAIDSGSVKVLNVIPLDNNYEKDFIKAYYEKIGRKNYAENDVNNVLKNNGVFSASDLSGKILVINLDLTGLDSYTIGNFKVAGHNSTDKFDEMDSRVIINPVVRVDGSDTEFVPYSGTLNLQYAMGTILAPCAKVVEDGLNGAVIGKYVHVRNGEIHKFTLMRVLDISGTVTVTNSGKTVPKGKIVKNWNGETAYPFIYAYVCARAYSQRADGSLAGYKDLPQYSTLIKLQGESWSSEVSFPFETYTEGGNTYKILYRVVEVNAFKNGVSGEIYSEEELDRKLKDGVTTNDAGTSLFIYDDNDGVSDVVNGYFTSYSSSISASVTNVNGADRLIYYPGLENADRTVTITNTQVLPYELYAYKLVDGQPAKSDQTFSYTIKFWDGSKWATLAVDLHNGKMRTSDGDTDIDPYKLGYTVYPSKLGMNAGNSYYFLLTENPTTGSGYTQDTSKILVEIKNTQNHGQGVSNEINYYLYDQNTGKYKTLDTGLVSGDDEHKKNGSDIRSVDSIPAFKNYASTKVVVKKHWGAEGDTGAKDFAFDVNIALFRKLEGQEDKDAVQVEGRILALKKGTESVEFTDLPVYDNNGDKYIYFVKEYYGDQEFVLDTTVINEFKLKSITSSEVAGGTEITLTNVPVITIEKEWTKNRQKIAKDKGMVSVRLYQSKNDGTPVKIGDYQLYAKYGWKQTVEVPRGYSNEEYTYYIVELMLDGTTERDESAMVTYEASDGQGTRTGIKPSEVCVFGKSGSVLKLKVINEMGDNVLPSTGGMGDIPFLATGLGTTVAGLLGVGAYSRKKKKDGEEE